MPNLKAKYIIDENGDRVAPITYIDAVRNSNGDSLSDLMVPEKLGSGIGTCSTSSGTALTVSLTGYELVQNGFVAVTFANDVPANATLNVNNKGAKPIYYKGSAITADTIKADDTVMFCYDGTNYVVTSLGGGGSVEFVEYLSINLMSDVITSDPALIGAIVVVTDDDNSETILSTTWQGTTIETTISSGIHYTITVGSVSDYRTPSTKSYLAMPSYNRTVEFLYITKFVDLGLPSGLKWATSNIGATNSYDAGYYFSWGNVIGHNQGGPATGEYSFDATNYTGTPGFALTADIAIGETYDAARAIMGADWRMPTRTEYQELINNTDSEWTTYNGIRGMKYMKKTDHNVFIFLPVVGDYSDTSLRGKGEWGNYWTRSIHSDSGYAYSLYLNNTSSPNNKDARTMGFQIRAVL